MTSGWRDTSAVDPRRLPSVAGCVTAPIDNGSAAPRHALSPAREKPGRPYPPHPESRPTVAAIDRMSSKLPATPDHFTTPVASTASPYGVAWMPSALEISLEGSTTTVEALSPP